MARDSFEVYYIQNGRWQLHASFEANQRELAIEEAKTVEAKEGYATRVVRETFYPETNTSEEAISWQSPKAKTLGDADSMFAEKTKQQQKKKRPPPKPVAATAAPRPAPSAPKPAAKPVRKAKPKRKKRGVALRVLIMTATSVGIGAIIAVLTNLLVAYFPVMGLSRSNNPAQLFVGTFVLVFFLTFLINLQRQFGIFGVLRSHRTAKTASAAAPAAARAPSFVQEVEFDQVEVESLREKIAGEDAEFEEADEEPAELDADLGAEVRDEEGFEAVAAEPAPAVQVEEPRPAPPPEKPPERPPERIAEKPPEKTTEKPPEKGPPPKSPAEIDARTGFSRFVSEVMGLVASDQLNAFSRFGLNLYLAGAGSVIGQAKRLARDIQLAVLRDGLQLAGSSGERAEAFCVELPTYGKNPRYAGMVQAGAKAMTEHLAGARNAAGGVPDLLNEWNLPEKRPTVPSVITFMFTDIVGSTEMTQRLGNAGAQKAVRAHNSAVRNAIQARKGREVKHTGDGIMATFPDPASAVAGAIQAQREIAAHNSSNPTLQVNVRIGVNVGEAVEEDNDFFGAAVQMTARICDKATKGNAWVSQAVVDACKGQRVGFIPRGRFEMKGIQGAKMLYEVGWTDAHKNELADL